MCKRYVTIKQHFMVTKTHNPLLVTLIEIASLRSQMGNCLRFKYLILYFYIKVVYILWKEVLQVSVFTTEMKIVHCTLMCFN